MASKRLHLIAMLTVRDIAERIRRPGEPLDAVVDRLRNWTKEGLLQAVGEKNPGTGRRRQYTETAVVDALVLSALTELGIPAVRVGRIRGEGKTLLQLARRAAAEAEQKEKNGQFIYVSIHLTFDEAHEKVFENAGRKPGTSVILHYTGNRYAPAVAGRPARLERSFEDITIPHWTEGSIVLNLTTLFRRLRNPVEK
jgi:hypothetical protein